MIIPPLLVLHLFFHIQIVDIVRIDALVVPQGILFIAGLFLGCGKVVVDLLEDVVKFSFVERRNHKFTIHFNTVVAECYDFPLRALRL